MTATPTTAALPQPRHPTTDIDTDPPQCIDAENHVCTGPIDHLNCCGHLCTTALEDHETNPCSDHLAWLLEGQR